MMYKSEYLKYMFISLLTSVFLMAILSILSHLELYSLYSVYDISPFALTPFYGPVITIISIYFFTKINIIK